MVEQLRGKLLIAAPSLYDWFRRTVVLVIEHTEAGALGVVLNRVSEARIADAVPALAGLAPADELVRLGGPVAPEAVIALGDFDDPAQAGAPLFGTLALLDPSARPRASGGCGSTPATPAGRRASSTARSSRAPGSSSPQRPTTRSATTTCGPPRSRARAGATP